MTGPVETVPPLARSTLDRAAHRRSDHGWLADAWARSRVLLVDIANGGQALIGPAPTAGTAAASDPPRLVLLGPDAVADGEPPQRLFLGVEPDGVPVFAVFAPLPAIPGARATTLREVGHLLDDRDAGLFTTAVALANWHALHTYSSRNGLPTTVSDGGWTRLDGTGRQIWPRTDPAMIVLINDGVPGVDGRCLLGNNAAWLPKGGGRRFSCLAGYVEPGESVEAAVVREVDEEVGLAIHQIEYAGSQAWPFPSSLMLGFLARADPDLPVRLDPVEIAAARWFTRREVAAAVAGESVPVGEGLRLLLPPPSSIAFFLINQWLSG